MFSDPVLVIIVLGSVLLSAVLHEFMHGFTAHRLGDDTAYHLGRLTLNPLKHIDPFITIIMPVMLALAGAPILAGAKPVPFNPNRVKGGDFGAALVGFAGPLTNILIAFIVGTWVRLFVDDAAGAGLYEVMEIFVKVNIGLFLFNMIPWPPLDGSRILYAFAPEPLQRFMRQIEAFGIAGILMFFFLIYPMLSVQIAELFDILSNFILGT